MPAVWLCLLLLWLVAERKEEGDFAHHCECLFYWPLSHNDEGSHFHWLGLVEEASYTEGRGMAAACFGDFVNNENSDMRECFTDIKNRVNVSCIPVVAMYIWDSSGHNPEHAQQEKEMQQKNKCAGPDAEAS